MSANDYRRFAEGNDPLIDVQDRAGLQGELRPLPGAWDRIVSRIAGPDPLPPAPATEREGLLDIFHELHTIAALLRELRDVESGAMVVRPLRLVVDAQRPFMALEFSAGYQFHALKVDNPSGVTAEIRYDGAQPLAGNSDDRVPAHTGRVIVRPFDAVSIGIDPAAPIPAGQTPLFVTLYSRPIAPATYAFAP